MIDYSFRPEPSATSDVALTNRGYGNQEASIRSANNDPTGTLGVTAARTTYAAALAGIVGVLYLLRYPSGRKTRRANVRSGLGPGRGHGHASTGRTGRSRIAGQITHGATTAANE